MAKRSQTIPIHPGTPLGQADPRTHFWYQSTGGKLLRLCDAAEWPDGVPPGTDNPAVDVPCTICRDLYVDDIARGRQLLDPQAPMDYPTISMVYSPKIGEYPLNPGGYSPLEGVPHMEIHTQPLTAFARFFEATPALKVSMVREARLFQSDPRGYYLRAYYGAFRNTLRQTHWKGSDIATFEAKLDDVIAEQTVLAKREHYRMLGEAYASFWNRYPDASVFEVPPVETEIAGLGIRVTAELGVSFGGDDYALDPYFRAPKPTRLFRQSIQYIAQQARQHVWNPNWQAAIYDVRREVILRDVRIRPQDLRIGLEGAAADFQQIWKSLES